MNQKAESTEVTVYNSEHALSVQSVKDQLDRVNDLLTTVMVDGQHYGKIPGTKKNTLLKAGAEKLCVMFQLVPKVEKIERDLGNGHREFELTISLYHRKTGDFWGQGVGSCSTMESKYRYRSDLKELGAVPQEYWDDRNNAKWQGCFPKKIDNVWKFFQRGNKIENQDIADTYNTVLKMAYKRALVSATITATGVSDIFTQDMEESVEDDTVTNSKPQNPMDDSSIPFKSDLELAIAEIEKEVKTKRTPEEVEEYRDQLRDRIKSGQIKDITKENKDSVFAQIKGLLDTQLSNVELDTIEY